MNKKHKSYYFGEINKFFHYVGGGSCIVLLLGYFLLDKIVNTDTRFFLCWTCVGILTVIVGIYFRIISGLGGVVTFVYMVATPLILVIIIVQSLFITYEAYSAAGKTWFGWWLVEHYLPYHVNCPDGCVSGEPAGGG